MAYNKTVWVNGSEPAISAENLNKIEDALEAQDSDISDLKSEIAQLEAIPTEVKMAMDNMFANAVYENYDASNDYAVFRLWAGVVDVVSIDAVFTQGNRTIFSDTELDSLKDYLVVTATYSNGEIETLEKNAYALSGELTTSTSTITATYEDVSDTFTVSVTALTLPEGYTRYGYVQKKTTGATNVTRASYILLNSYNDLNELSMEVTIGQKSSSSTGPAFFGARPSDYDSSYSLYNSTTNGVFGVVRRTQYKTDTFITAKTKFEIINPTNSNIYYWRLNNGELNEVEWTSTTPITCPIMLFNNAPYDDTTTKYSINAQARIGDMILRKADGECVGYYVPVTYDGVIGMYDFISETLYTAQTTSVVTVSNSGCLYSVGNW